jgi:hypothetical protein
MSKKKEIFNALKYEDTIPSANKLIKDLYHPIDSKTVDVDRIEIMVTNAIEEVGRKIKNCLSNTYSESRREFKIDTLSMECNNKYEAMAVAKKLYKAITDLGYKINITIQCSDPKGFMPNRMLNYKVSWEPLMWTSTFEKRVFKISLYFPRLFYIKVL